MSKVFPFSFKTSSWERCHTTGTHADIVHLPAQHSKQRWKYNPHVQSGPWCHYFPRPQSEGGSFINRSFTHLAIQSCHHVEKNKTKNPTLDQMQKLAHAHESSSTQTLLSVDLFQVLTCCPWRHWIAASSGPQAQNFGSCMSCSCWGEVSFGCAFQKKKKKVWNCSGETLHSLFHLHTPQVTGSGFFLLWPLTQTAMFVFTHVNTEHLEKKNK